MHSRDDSIRSLTRPVADAWRRPACVVLAVLTACFVFASATGLRTDLSARDHALQAMLNRLPASSRTIVVGNDYTGFVQQNLGPTDLSDTGAQATAESRMIAGALGNQTQHAYSALPDASGQVPVAPEDDAWTSLGSPTYYVGTYTTQFIAIYPRQPEIQFTYLEDYAKHARLVSGRWPQDIGTDGTGRFSVETALSTASLKLLGLHVGSRFLAQSGGSIPPPPITIVVTGEYQPIDPGSDYWQDQPSDVSPQWVGAAHLPAYRLTGGLLGQDELAPLALLTPFSPQGLDVQTHLPVRTASFTAGQAGAMTAALDSAMTEASSTLEDGYGGSGVTFQTQLVVPLAEFEAEQSAGRLETAMPSVSLALIGLIALLVAARAAVDRTSAQTAVQRARGAPLWRLAMAAARDAALTVVPLTAAAMLIAALIPGESPPRLWEYELVLPLTAVAGPAVLTALRHRRSGVVGGRSSAPRRTLVARRFVAQGTLIVLCLLGLIEAHSQGFSPSGGIDLFTASAPALAAILFALVMLNLGPVALRVLLRVVGSRRGAVGLLGLARTARTPAPAAVTILILALGLTTADLTVALHRTGGAEGAAAATAQAIYAAANFSGTSTITLPTAGSPDPMVTATGTYLALLAVLAVVTGCLVVALATAVEAKERRTVVARLTTMGLTAGQARAVTAVELLGPIALAAIAGTAAVPPLLWIVRPALASALGGADTRISAAALLLAPAAVAVLALAAGLGAAAAARRGVAGRLRLGDLAEGA